MKALLVFVLVTGLALVAGLVYGRRSATPRVIESTAPVIRRSDSAPPASKPGSASPATAEPAPPDEASLTVASAVLKLGSGKTSFAEKQRLWHEMMAAGSLDDVAAALKDLTARNPNDADALAALGQTLIFETIGARDHGDINRVYALGIEADQDFDAALQADPQNWEAQFFKASALSHWPPALNKGPQSLQILSNLLNQQQEGPAQPEYAQTYLVLGQEYQAMGQTDKALQTWQDGAAHFPTDANLLQRLSHGGK